MSRSSGAFSGERDAALRLSLAEGVGPRRAQVMIAEKGSAASALRARTFGPETLGIVGQAALEAVGKARTLDTSGYWDRAARAGAGAVTLKEPGYPVLLTTEVAPPPLLWVRPWPDGLEALGDRMAVAVVGTRRATPYGLRTARAIGRDLASRGVVVVSGLAYGVDREAHEGALEAGGVTVAVLGCGVDRIYPSAHRRLAHQVMEHGALVSEFEPGTEPAAGRFPRRNRIIAGMTRATVLVESHERGGALITARLAGEMGRPVFCVPGPVDSPASRGVHRYFVESGTHLVASVGDIARGLGLDGDPAALPLPGLSAVERMVLDAVPAEPVSLDAITDAADLDVSIVLSSLLTLELKGCLRQVAGRHYMRLVEIPA